MEERYGTWAGAGSCLPSLGILFLAAITRQKGFPTAVTDASALSLTSDALLKQVEAERPDVLGLSATTFSVSHATHFAALAKGRCPGLTVIIGGPHVSAAPQATMERFPAFDVAVLGEGEVTIIELLEAMDAKASLGGIDVRSLTRRQLRSLTEKPEQSLGSPPIGAFALEKRGVQKSSLGVFL